MAYALALIASSIGFEFGGVRAAETRVDKLANSGSRSADFMFAAGVGCRKGKLFGVI
jgi:hypothetical protein